MQSVPGIIPFAHGSLPCQVPGCVHALLTVDNLLLTFGHHIGHVVFPGSSVTEAGCTEMQLRMLCTWPCMCMTTYGKLDEGLHGMQHAVCAVCNCILVY